MILHWLLLAIRYCSIVSLAGARFIDNSSVEGIVEATRYGYVYEGAGFIASVVTGAGGGRCGWCATLHIMGPLRSKVSQTTKIASFSSLNDLLHAQKQKPKSIYCTSKTGI